MNQTSIATRLEVATLESGRPSLLRRRTRQRIPCGVGLGQATIQSD